VPGYVAPIIQPPRNVHDLFRYSLALGTARRRSKKMSRNFFWGLFAFSAGTGSCVYGILDATHSFTFVGTILILMGSVLICDAIVHHRDRS
jgi:hypothetical protein